VFTQRTLLEVPIVIENWSETFKDLETVFGPEQQALDYIQSKLAYHQPMSDCRNAHKRVERQHQRRWVEATHTKTEDANGNTIWTPGEDAERKLKAYQEECVLETDKLQNMRVQFGPGEKAPTNRDKARAASAIAGFVKHAKRWQAVRKEAKLYGVSLPAKPDEAELARFYRQRDLALSDDPSAEFEAVES
jgi:hypothetical protein